MKKNKRKKAEHHVDESWLLPYSDLLTLLVALFIVLFAMSEIDVKKYEELSTFFRSEFSSGDKGIMEHPVPSPELKEQQEVEEQNQNHKDGQHELQNLQELQKRIDAYIQENGLTESLGTNLSGEGLMITIKNDISFEPGSAEVNQGGIKIANEISRLLYTDPPHQVVISGHTDDVPMNNEQFGSNWELSVMRAVNFMTLILDNEQLDPAKFSAKGFGEHQPLVPNNSAENRAINRRVEVLILPNYDITEHLP
ncbi:flagellar motor protein MotB [Ornithinibacillus sp. BX22]|uniref:Flagellar motor protein MotB n=1 Tax=Ornithinibacillus hominis TaxID=2763055 RepID=A0A923L7H8_9BACI|nr:flagellar motor protein MotB [Ornithinibacillus hominis]MBC5637935.1 flagellar motor protein MotB [Ornithinibacillus hominis]